MWSAAVRVMSRGAAAEEQLCQPNRGMEILTGEFFPSFSVLF